MVKKSRTLGNQSGQMIVEAILLLFLFFGVSFALAQYFQSQELVAQMISKPWKTLSGMIQNGVWDEPRRGGGRHPATHMRHVSLEGDSPR